MRIAIAGIAQESCTFSPVLAGLDDFIVVRGEELFRHPEIADTLDRQEIEPVPILYARSPTPNGPVKETAYLALRQEILDGLRTAGGLDGICLVLHGSMSVENIFSGETDLVRHIRAALGYKPLLAVRLDLHANLTEEFANKTDIWAGYRTAPHRDQPQTLQRTLRLLARCIRKGLRPQPVFIRVPILIPGEKATTEIDPIRSLLDTAREIEQQPGILNAEILVGFANTDTPYSGMTVAVIAEDKAHLPYARRAAKTLAQTIWDRREQFDFDRETAATLDEAIDTALQSPLRSVFIADVGDNPTAGVPGDMSYSLQRLLAMQVPDAVLAGIADRPAAHCCFEAGVGASIRTRLGGTLDPSLGAPIEVTGTVEHLYRPSAGVREAAIATLRVAGVLVLITDIRKQFIYLDDFTKTGVNPLDHKILVLKLGYLHAELRDVAPREILALTPGYNDMDLTRLPFKWVTHPIYPLERDFAWRPIITNVAGFTD